MKPFAEATDDDRRAIWNGMKALNALVSPASSALWPLRDGSFEQRWVSPSLLASLAMMVLQDLTEHRRILRCTTCGRIFVSAAYQAQYCSAKCRSTAQKRAYRERVRQKEAESSAVS